MFRELQHLFVFQQDNACHKAVVVKACFESNDRRNMLFPRQSPDVNPIENTWSWRKKDVGDGKANNM